MLLTARIREFLESQRLGYVATVSKDGMPNISPKGTIIGWDEDTIAFAEIRSPHTMSNLRTNPNMEINVIDPLSRRGYLFRGRGRIVCDGGEFDAAMARYREMGVRSRINSVILVSLSGISEVTSPVYDLGMTEDEVRSRWIRHYKPMI